MMNFRNIVLPPKVRRGDEVKAEDHNRLIEGLRLILKKMDSIRIKTSADVGVKKSDASGILLYSKKSRRASKATDLRFAFGGLVKEEDVWRVRIGVGTVLYNEIFDASIWESGHFEKRRIVKAVYPTIDVDGDDVRIDDESRPTIELGDRSAGSVWLIVDGQKCGSSLDHERLIVTDRGVKPKGDEVKRGEVCVPIVDFDVETTGEGETEQKSATNIYTWLQSDHQQPYLCDDDDSESGSDIQSEPESDFPPDSSDSGFASDGSASSDSGSEEDGEECQVKARAYFIGTGLPDCLPAVKDCKPKPLTITVTAEFFRSLNPAFGQHECRRWVFGVKMLGATKVPEPGSGDKSEYVWADDWQRACTFKIAVPPPCQSLVIEWRVKSWSAPSGPFEGTPYPCCGQEWSGTEEIRTYRGGPVAKTPKVCGASCSSCSSSL